MTEPFISNHQYNFIRRQAGHLQSAIKTSADPKVIEAVRANTEFKVLDQFPQAGDAEKQLLRRLTSLRRQEDFQEYLLMIKPYVIEFPLVDEAAIRKLFPKVKKIRIPETAEGESRMMTYLGWTDPGLNKWFLVYELGGKMVGVEAKYTPAPVKDLCALCSGYGEVALVTAVTRGGSSHSPDYYKSVGNYMCIDSHECNKQITDVSYLEKFIQEVTG